MIDVTLCINKGVELRCGLFCYVLHFVVLACVA